MAGSVWFIGYADVREIDSTSWTAAGAPGVATRWDIFNGWSLPQSILTPAQITYLDNHDEFIVTVVDGPRPGIVISPEPYGGMNPADVRELLEDFEIEWDGRIDTLEAESLIFVGAADPNMTEPGLWIQTGVNGDGITFWVEDGT